MTEIHDQMFLECMASNLPMSSSFVRQSRWEADVAETLSVHLCKEDEDGQLIDDFDSTQELDAHGITDDGRQMRAIYEQLDEHIGGPLYPVDRNGNVDWHQHEIRMAQHKAWEMQLRSLGIQTSGIVDRYYFRSIYFREPNGILFELATDGPGFDVDEPLTTLGERLALPPFLEPRRADIEANLKPLAYSPSTR